MKPTNNLFSHTILQTKKMLEEFLYYLLIIQFEMFHTVFHTYFHTVRYFYNMNEGEFRMSEYERSLFTIKG